MSSQPSLRKVLRSSPALVGRLLAPYPSDRFGFSARGQRPFSASLQAGKRRRRRVGEWPRRNQVSRSLQLGVCSLGRPWGLELNTATSESQRVRVARSQARHLHQAEPRRRRRPSVSRWRRPPCPLGAWCPAALLSVRGACVPFRGVEMTDRDEGTKVHTHVVATNPASLLPLQQALGYDLAQSLFAQSRNLVPEGLTDY
jgi:hypothetical protein